MKKISLYGYLNILEREKLTVTSTRRTMTVDTELLSTPVSSLSADSRRSERNGIFFCKGRHFSKEYLIEALEKGTVAVVYEKTFPSDSGFSSSPAIADAVEELLRDESFKDRLFIEVKNVRKAMASIAAFHYGYPMQKAVTVAVTGTKGKTGTVTAICAALNENPSFKAIILNDALPKGSPHLTTPEPIEFHAAAENCIKEGATHVICEISSQGMKELRTWGVVFDLACFLNFGSDHVSPYEHSAPEDYFNSKAELFSFCKRALVNTDSEKATEIIRKAEKSDRILTDATTGKKDIFTFSDRETDATFSAKITEKGESGYFFTVKESGFTNVEGKCFSNEKDNASPLYVNTPGRFNVQNALCAYSACRLLGCTPDDIFRGLLFSKADGRMEIFDTADGRVRIIVDYAHNEMSFEALFKAAREMYPSDPPRITAIFGCPGEKAYKRRYELPRVALTHSDRIIICEDDSGREPFEGIKNDILRNISDILSKPGEGCEKTASISVIKNRESAIETAVSNAYENGEKRLILFTGKGRESTLSVNGEDIPMTDDVRASLNAIKRYNERLSLDTLFSGLSDKSGETFTVSLEAHKDVVKSFSETVPRLLRAGMTIITVCDEGAAEGLRESCYKNGTVCNFISFDPYGPKKSKVSLCEAPSADPQGTLANAASVCAHGDAQPIIFSSDTLGIKEEARHSSRRGALTVVTVKGDVKRIASEISVREKSDSLVYLTQSGGIIISGRVFQAVLSEKSAAAISEKVDCSYLDYALLASKGGVKTVAVIDGREKDSLAFYGIGSGYIGTVIKKVNQSED